jgi:hypothetical protein
MSIVSFSRKSTRGTRGSKAGGITGRDGYLVLQAFAYAILTIERLPDEQQEWSNKEQMKILLDLWSRGHSEDFLDNARFHIDRSGRIANALDLHYGN